MNDKLITAKLTELAAIAESAAIKQQNKKFWDGELESEINRIIKIAEEIKRML